MSGCKGLTNYFDYFYFYHWNSNKALLCITLCKIQKTFLMTDRKTNEIDKVNSLKPSRFS